MSGRVFIRPFGPGDEVRYLELYNLVHPVGMTAEYWNWLNFQCPGGPSLIETAWNGSDLVGVYGLTPTRIWMGGEEVKGALSGAAVTHPEYRYRGIFKALGKSLYRRAAQAGIKIIYGFPTEHSRHGFRGALGWPAVVQGFDFVSWGGIRDCGEGWEGEITEADHDSGIYDHLWKRLISGPLITSVLAVRGDRYMAWRFGRFPGGGYSILNAYDQDGPAGYAAVRRLTEYGEVIAEITDITASGVQCFRRLLACAANYFREAACLKIRLPAGSIYSRSAMGMGFKEKGGRYYFGYRPLEAVPENGLDWLYTAADAV